MFAMWNVQPSDVSNSSEGFWLKDKHSIGEYLDDMIKDDEGSRSSQVSYLLQH